MAIQLSDNIFVGQQKPVEDKYYNGLSPYTNTAQVNSTLDSAIRYRGLTVNVNGVEYWYRDGIADGDLVSKGGGGGSIEVQDEGSSVENAATILNFTGSGVVATGSGGTATINIPGGTAITVTTIDLSLANFNISGPGTYIVKNGTDYAAGSYKIFFPNPASFNQGDVITIINKDSAGLLAELDVGSAYQYYQGSTKLLSIIPWGMVYIFEAYRDGGADYWVCTPPTAQPVYDIDLIHSGPYRIQTNGVYTIIANDTEKTSRIQWPNPVNHAGQEVTIINNTELFGVFISWDGAPNTEAWMPIYNYYFKSIYSTLVLGIPSNSTYTFLSNGEFWYLKSSYPVINNLQKSSYYDLRAGSVQLPDSGVYFVYADPDGINSLEMPNAIYFPGQFITVINSNTVQDIVLSTSTDVTSIYGSFGGQTGEIPAGRIITVNSIGGLWYVV
jgi:hypothetical protein